jgi:L-ascorbate metabolism protein UlaG (beta-lactamase superfamily)
MELEFFGGNCFRIKTKQTTIVIDDNLEAMGKKSILSDKVAAFYSSDVVVQPAKNPAYLMIDSPGEFEVGDVTVKGVQARAHVDEGDKKSATVFQFMHSGQTISVLGHVHPDLEADVLELISGTDVLVVPVGGNGFTLDPIGASSIIKKTEPAVIVPSQYELASAGLTYEVPAQPLSEFAKVASLNMDCRF